ncbi:MAG: hypothetical protein AAF492_04485, partial [Verrucomicrobiota bacterium]
DAIPLNASNLTNLNPGADFQSADKIYLFNGISYDVFFLDLADRRFKTPILVETSVLLEPNLGFWVEHKGAGFQWIEVRPYTLP